MTRRRRGLGALVAVLVLALTSGCTSLSTGLSAQVPTTGPIQQGEQVGVEPEDQFIRVIAREPRAGMSTSEVVQGFLDASASFDKDHAVARMYLTPEASAEWRTGDGVTVYDGAASLQELGSAVVMSAREAARIAANGRYTVRGPAAEYRTTFDLTRVDGEWRIEKLPQGLLLSQSDVDRAFRSFSVYFFNPEFETLVPDPRMVPVIGPGLATTLVRQLVAGPSEWLLPAVRTGFPAGVRLNIDAVPIEAGVARVDLTANARSADDRTRQALSQQIVWTLRQLPDVQAVEITAGGQPLLVPGAPSPQPRDAWPAVDPNGLAAGAAGYATRPDGVVRLIPDGVRAVPGGAGTGDTILVDIAIASDSQSVAGIGIDGAVWQGRMVEGAPLIRIREPGTATSVQFDGSSSVWVVDATEGLLAVSSDGTAEPITVDGLSRRTTLIAAIPARDGARAALVIRRGPRTGLLLARVIRTAGSSSRIVVDEPVRIESRLVEVVDAAWSGADTLSVLGSESAGTLQVFDIDIARGSSVPVGTPIAPLTVGAAPGLPTLVGAADGLVYELTAGAWVERVRGSAPAYPG
jgi:hypothetical protein